MMCGGYRGTIYLILLSSTENPPKSYVKAKIRKRHFNTTTLSKDLPRKNFQLPSQQFSKDTQTETKGLMEKKLSGEI